MKLLVVDDEALARQRLRRLVQEIEGYEVCGEAANGLDALERSSDLSPDIVLMDIRMPGMDGLEAARHLGELEQPPAVIFTTAYGEHALDAFDAHAVGYLLKPVRAEALEQALAQAGRLTRAQADALDVAARSAGQRQGRSHLSVRVGTSIRLVPISEVRYFKADSKYVLVRTADAEVLIEDSLKNLEVEYADRFLRVHRGALISTAHLRGLERAADGRMLARLDGIDEGLEVSRRLVPEVRRWMQGMPP